LIRHRSGGPQILVDVGIGDKFDSKFRDRFAVHDPIGGNGPPITRALSNFGVHPDEITHVILTHLHFDHGGGISTIDRSNELVPTFAGATHYIQRANLATAKDPNPREKASYLRENVEPLDTVQLEQVDGDAELFPGVSVIRSDGHTTGMQVVRLESDGRVIYFPADLAPTQHHVPIPFTMGYDLSAREIMAEKAKVWRRAVEEEAVVVFEHDTQIAAGQLQEDGDRYRLSAAIDFQ